MYQNRKKIGVFWSLSRHERKKEKDIKGVIGLGLWACGLCRPKERKRKENWSVWFVNCIRGPLGVGGPHGVFQISCRGSKILVSVLGKFRRFGEYINSIWYLDETYNNKYKRFIYIYSS